MGRKKITKEWETMANLETLNEILFRQLERIENCDNENIEIEIERSKAVTSLAGQVISNGRLVLDASKASMTTAETVQVPKMLLP